jgi:uncharacterized protein YjbI with pentapeptide repeats
MTNDEEKLSAADVLRLYALGQRDFRQLEIDERHSCGLRGAVLEEADFSGAFIVADFSEARLRGASFRAANVKTCNFERADLSNTDFRDAAIDAARFGDATFNGANFEGASAQGYTWSKGEYPT